MAQQHSRRAYIRRREQKKKKRLRIWIIVLAVMLISAAVLYTLLQDHLVFTAEGVKIVFSQSNEDTKPENTAGMQNLPQENREGFFPRIAASVSVDSNGLPPYGAGYIDAVWVDAASIAAAGADAVAAQLVIDEIRSIVIDIKCDDGRLNYDSDTAYSRTAVLDTESGILEAFLAQCRDRGIRVTGRISCFRDNTLPRKMRVTGMFTKENKLFEDEEGYTWLDPYEADVHEYLIQICAEAAALGVREILLDNFSFLGENPDDDIKFSDDADRSVLLETLFSGICKEIGDDVYLSVVVYPDVLGEGGSESKGQDLGTLASLSDRLWIRCESAAQIPGYVQQARTHSVQTADMLAVILDERFASASLFDY